MATNQQVVFNSFYLQDLMDQTDWLAAGVHCLLLRNDGPGLGNEWFVKTLSQKKAPATLDALWAAGAVEITSTGYTRQSVTPSAIAIETAIADRGEWRITESEVEFGNPIGDATQQTIEAVVIYTGLVTGGANDATNVPLIMQEYENGKPTADGPVTANFTDGDNALWFETQP